MTPRQIGIYRLDDLLGSGGMGDVYKAYDTHRERYVALKLLPAAFSGDEAYLKRFRRESNVVARLREPHLIPIHDFGEVNGQLFIDMRLVDGADIGALLDANGRIAPQRAVHLIGQVAQALDAAHADQLVHRDIKPSNILVTSSDFVYVVDFGVARPLGARQASLTTAEATIGTLHYMAPERFAGQEVDGRADVYSLACVLHECLTGVPPFSGKDDLPSLMYAHLHSVPPQASTLAEGVPPALDAVIARGMAKDPGDRFPTAGALAAAAREALLAEASTSAMTEPPVQMREPPVQALTEIPDPTWQAAGAAVAMQSLAAPLGSEAEPAGDRFAHGVAGSQTQTIDWGGAPPPQDMPRGAGPDLDGSRPPARGPAWRRLSVLILVLVAVLAVPIALILVANARSHKDGAAAAPNTGGATGTSATGTSATGTGTAGAAGSVRTVAVLRLAGEISVGQTPNYIQVAPNGKFAYITNPGARAIIVLNTADDQLSKPIPIPQGTPQSVSFSPDSRTAYVSVYGSKVHLIAFIDTATRTVTRTVQVDNISPGPSATGQGGRYLYVPNHSMVKGTGDNLVDVIDTASGTLIHSIPVKPNPHWAVFDKENGRLYVTDHLSAVITVLNASDNSLITTVEVGETPHSEAISPDGSRLAVTSYSGNEVFLVNTVTDKEVKAIPVGSEPLDIAYSPDGRYIFTVNNLDNTVSVIDTADNSVVDTVRTGKAPTSISVLPNGRQAYVTDENDGTIEILNLAK